MKQSIYDMLGVHKVLEFNKSFGLNVGHVEAQTKLTELSAFSGLEPGVTKYLDNGTVLYLDIDGQFKFKEDATVAELPFLVYNEELFDEYSKELRHYTNWFPEGVDEDNEANGRVLYPRGVALYVGDVFVTNNYTGTLAGAKYAKVGDDGVFALLTTMPTASSYTGPIFSVVEYTLPDGTTEAPQLTVIATNVAL